MDASWIGKFEGARKLGRYIFEQFEPPQDGLNHSHICASMGRREYLPIYMDGLNLW